MKRLPTVLVLSLIIAITSSACGALNTCASEEIFCVGLVTDVGGIADKSANQFAWEGVQQAAEKLGAQVEYLESKAPDDYARNIARFAEDDYDLIVTVGFDLADETLAAAAIYPDVDFIGIDQVQAETVEGVAGLVFADDQAGFLAGALAAIMSRNQTIGAVCASEQVPYVWRFGEGYKAGAAYADQMKGVSTQVLVAYHGDAGKSFADPAWGESTARTMLNQNADVIVGCGGSTGTGAMIAAAQAGVYTIGTDADQYLIVPEAAPRILTSVTRQIGNGVFELINFARDGQFPSGNYVGAVSYAPYHDLEDEVPPAVKAVVEQINAGLLDGSIRTNIPLTSP